MTAYYNENDAKAAAWLRELIAEGHIAAGEVDERSIADVEPRDLVGFTQCHFFAGIGGWSYALRLAGWPDDRPIWTGSCPCQPFSAAGQGKGVDDPRHLWPAWSWLIRQCQPSIVFGEQVASKAGRAWFSTVQADLQGLGYAAAASDICAAGIGAPHWRQRLWFVGVGNSSQQPREWGAGRLSGAQEEKRGAWQLNGGRDNRSEHAGAGILERVADASDQRRQRGRSGEAGSEPGTLERPERSRDAVGMGQSDRAGRQQGWEAVETARHGSSTEPAGDVDGLAHADGPGRGQAGCDAAGGPEEDGAGPRNRNSDGGSLSGVADANGVGQQRGAFEALQRTGRREERPETGLAGVSRTQPEPFASALNNLWADADWLLCTDGKWRPVEPGTFPLAHGVPDRVGLLRGYGNAIVPQVAAEFIEAVKEATST